MDRIGPFQFIRLSRAPERAVMRWSTMQTAGIDGSSLWGVGRHGRPFQVQSLAAFVNFVQARAVGLDYQSLIETGPVDVAFGTTEPVQLYKVLDVQPHEPKAIVRGKFGGNPINHQALLTADWLLLPLDPFAQAP